MGLLANFLLLFMEWPILPIQGTAFTWSEAFPAVMSDRRRTLNRYLLNRTRSDASLERSVFNFSFLADTSDIVYIQYLYSHPFNCSPVTCG